MRETHELAGLARAQELGEASPRGPKSHTPGCHQHPQGTGPTAQAGGWTADLMGESGSPGTREACGESLGWSQPGASSTRRDARLFSCCPVTWGSKDLGLWLLAGPDPVMSDSNHSVLGPSYHRRVPNSMSGLHLPYVAFKSISRHYPMASQDEIAMLRTPGLETG